ncbi:hypothetical protein ACU686_20720 [Yinghuangia aomiensis]
MASRKRPGDLVVDLDALWSALGEAGTHDQPEALRPYVLDARDAVMERLWRIRDVDAWVIATAPEAAMRQSYRNRGARVVLVYAEESTCLARAETERPPAWSQYIRNWFDRYQATPHDVLVRTDQAPM